MMKVSTNIENKLGCLSCKVVINIYCMQSGQSENLLMFTSIC